MSVAAAPSLTRIVSDGVAVWVDLELEKQGVLVAFTERTGGVSLPPFASLNLAGHVGDDSRDVDENRDRLLRSLGIGSLGPRLVTAEQVHGEHIAVIGEAQAGRGARVSAGEGPLPATDAVVTLAARVPVMLFFADCVPVVLVAPGRAIAVVHAGWRGALAGLPGKTVAELAQRADVKPREVTAYVGPHIGACHYEVGDEIMSQFFNAFGTVARAESGGLDLGSVVAASLTSSGVDPCRIACLGTCTAEATERFFSYRAEGGLTGRHGALACIL